MRLVDVLGMALRRDATVLGLVRLAGKQLRSAADVEFDGDLTTFEIALEEGRAEVSITVFDERDLDGVEEEGGTSDAPLTDGSIDDDVPGDAEPPPPDPVLLESTSPSVFDLDISVPEGYTMPSLRHDVAALDGRQDGGPRPAPGSEDAFTETVYRFAAGPARYHGKLTALEVSPDSGDPVLVRVTLQRFLETPVRPGGVAEGVA